jgi:DNA-binding NarL/FixJ family response regulator
MIVEPAPSSVRARELRVVVVDDHPAVRDGLAALLSTDPGIAGVWPATGETALSVVQQRRPDVVLMDMAMPVVDGAAATVALASSGFDVPVLLLTGRPDPERIRVALEAGALGFLTKDVDPMVLLGAVHAAANGQWPPDPPDGLPDGAPA